MRWGLPVWESAFAEFNFEVKVRRSSVTVTMHEIRQGPLSTRSVPKGV
jgi:hypothetical protein